MSYTDLLKLNRRKEVIAKAEVVVPEEKSVNDTVIPRNHESLVSSEHDTSSSTLTDDPIIAIRRAVIPIGKEPATHRFTLEEKNHLDEIEYHYRKQYRIRTTENEITRIAVNYLLHNYRQNGETSILHKVLESIHR